MNYERTAKLETVIGRTCLGPNYIDVCDSKNIVAYIAESTVVVLNLENGQEHHVLGSSTNLLKCLSLSTSGNFLVTGEEGINPCVRIFELFDKQGQFKGKQIKEIRHHLKGTDVVKFVPNSDLIVSVGSESDSQLAIWAIDREEPVAVARLNSRVTSLAFSPDGSSFVTVGVKHVKFWTLPKSTEAQSGLQARSAILAHHRSSTFVDCVFVEGNRLLAVTDKGVLVELTNKKYTNAFTLDGRDSEESRPVSIATTKQHIVIGYSCGRVRLYNPNNLSRAVSILPYPAAINCDPSTVLDNETLTAQTEDLPSVSVVRCLSHGTVISVHSDSSMYINEPSGNKWLRCSHLAQSSSVNDVLLYPSEHPFLPENSFITAGDDGSIRIWSLEQNDNDFESSVPTENMLSQRLLKVINLDLATRQSTDSISSTRVTSLAISSDGRHLTAGTSRGNIHVFNLAEPFLPQIYTVEAHDAEITCMTYSDNSSEEVPSFFATGGGDRLVHIFIAGADHYEHVQVLEELAGTLKKIQFLNVAEESFLYTCATGGTVVIWRLEQVENVFFFHFSFKITFKVKYMFLVYKIGPNIINIHKAQINTSNLQTCVSFTRIKKISCSSEISDIAVSRRFSCLWTLGADYTLRIFSWEGNLLHEASIRKEGSNVQEIAETLSLDSSESAATVTTSGGSSYLIDGKNGHCLASFGSAGSRTTRALIGKGTKNVILTTSSGCIFIWQLSKLVVSSLQSRKTKELRASTFDDFIANENEIQPSISGQSHGEHDFDQPASSGKPKKFLISSPIEETQSTFTVQAAQVTRKSSNNLFAAVDQEGEDTEANDSQSDFISRRRPVQKYQSSKSMLNIREGGFQLMGADDGSARMGRDRQSAGTRRVRPAWGTAQPPTNNDWRGASGDTIIAHAQPYNPQQYQQQTEWLTPTRDPSQGSRMQYQRGNTEGFSLTPQYQQPKQRYDSSPGPAASSASALSQIKALSRTQTPSTSPFKRESGQRISLSKRHMEGNEPRTMWSPAAMTPRRTISNMHSNTPSGAAASAITRRPDDYTSSQLHLRSRSQSPNQMLLRQQATPNSSGLTKDLQRRRDSDMSYTAVSSRMTPATSRSNLREGETRKSTDALNKLAAIRSKLHQSSENLRKSSENLSMPSNDSSSIGRVRTRSISNLRGNALETAGTFETDNNQRMGSSLAHSRMLARSMGNVSQSGDNSSVADSPGIRLQNTIAMLKKASNPDLTNEGMYEDDYGSPVTEKVRRRGAVQKKVERYHPRNNRNLSTRPQTSEESDSNASDASPLNQSINRRGFGGTQRSISSVESSPRPGLASRRLFEQQRYTNVSSPRRTNYLAQKLANDDVAGPDLGSDDSPRSSVNASEWSSLLDEKSDCQQLVKHVQECCDQLQVKVDQIVHARKMVDDSPLLTSDQKRIMYSQLDRVTRAGMEKLSLGKSHLIGEDANGNDYTPIKATPIYKQQRF